MQDNSLIVDSAVIEVIRGVMLGEDGRQEGVAVVQVFGPGGELKQQEVAHNLITDAGDLYNATRVIAGVSPAAPADATKVTGMKLGTGTTAAAKNGAGAALVTYLSASNQAFDASYPQSSNLGAGAGVTAVYKVTFAPGVATNAALTEAVIVNDSATNATSTAANTISRVVFGAVSKGASDTLAITWSHKFLGA